MSKETELVNDILNLKKVKNIVASVVSAFDISGSMTDEYRSGLMDRFAIRLIPIAMRFDDDGSVENYVFNNRAKRVGSITLKNCSDFVKKNITPTVGGGTSFQPIIETIFNDYFTKANSSKGLFGFGSKTSLEEIEPENPIYLIFQTDGENDDKRETEKILAILENKGIYIQFIGIGTDTTFEFIKHMAERYSNVGFCHIKNLSKTSDEELYNLLINDEFIEFMKTRYPKNIEVA